MTMKDWFGVLQIVVTLIGMYVAPKLAIHYSLKQFRSQKWWEKQEEAYRTLLERLAVIRFCNFNRLDALLSRGEQYNPGQETNDALRRANHALELYAAAGSYLISTRAAEALLQYYRDVDGMDENNEASVYETLHGAAAKCLEVIKDEAKKSLA